jgi:hypothetical protein
VLEAVVVVVDILLVLEVLEAVVTVQPTALVHLRLELLTQVAAVAAVID